VFSCSHLIRKVVEELLEWKFASENLLCEDESQGLLGSCGLSRSAQGVKGKARIFDELWTFLKVRRGLGCNLWVWVSHVDGVPFFTVGDRDYRTFYRLFVNLPRGEVNYSDQYQVYQVLYKHVTSEDHTQAVESFNSQLRSSLARLARDTKAVTRSLARSTTTWP